MQQFNLELLLPLLVSFVLFQWAEELILQNTGSSFQHYLGETFFDVMDNLSSKYMLPFGGMMTAIFILVRWGVPSFLSEFGGENLDSEKNRLVVTILCFIAAGVAGFILLNELIETITGNAIIG